MFRRAEDNLNLKVVARHPAVEIFHRASRSNLNPRRRQDEGARPAVIHAPKRSIN